MELNPIFFPAPKPSYSGQSKNIIWITGDEPKYQTPKCTYRKFKNYQVKAKIMQKNTGLLADCMNNTSIDQQKKLNKQPIPCLYLPYKEGSDSILLYFHGNAEDLGYSYDFTDSLRKHLQINVLSVEYPGYGAYKGKPSSNQILEDSETIFDFLTNTLNINQKKIFVFGRSIGSGPATHLASKKRPGALLLMCPYTSIRDIVKDVAGSWAQYLVADRFKNIDKIAKVRCPSFFVHGQLDKLIPYQHSINLMSKCPGMTYLNLSPTMTHNEFKLTEDIINPLKQFLSKCQINIRVGNREDKIIINTLIFRKEKPLYQVYENEQNYEINKENKNSFEQEEQEKENINLNKNQNNIQKLKQDQINNFNNKEQEGVINKVGSNILCDKKNNII